ncbi:hypothetical protein OG851_00605 [Streptomyces sp. NBC_00161]
MVSKMLARFLVPRQGSDRGALLVLLGPTVAVSVDLDRETARQRVDHAQAQAAEAAGDPVAGAGLGAEGRLRQLAFGARLAGGLLHLDGQAPPVVRDANAAVRGDRDVDGVGVAGKVLVDGVPDDLVHQLMQAALAGRAMYMPGRLRIASCPSSTWM